MLDWRFFGWLGLGLWLDTGSGVLNGPSGGGTGFHVGEDGALGYFSSQDVITTSTDTGINVRLDQAENGGFVWYTLGFRTRWNDAEAQTGSTQFYINGEIIGTIGNGLPMKTSGGSVYAVTYEYINGPSGRLINLGLDWIISGTTRPGLSMPYDTGNW